jgi:hypothetical protein
MQRALRQLTDDSDTIASNGTAASSSLSSSSLGRIARSSLLVRYLFDAMSRNDVSGSGSGSGIAEDENAASDPCVVLIHTIAAPSYDHSTASAASLPFAASSSLSSSSSFSSAISTCRFAQRCALPHLSPRARDRTLTTLMRHAASGSASASALADGSSADANLQVCEKIRH